MAYVAIGSGRNGKTKYKFDTRILGHRYRRQISCPKSVVKSLFAKWERDLYDRHGSPIDKYMLFEKMEEYVAWMKMHKAAYMAVHEEQILKMAMGQMTDMRLHEIRRRHIEDFISWRKNNINRLTCKVISPATVNRSIAVLSYFFNWCLKREYYAGANPASHMKLSEMNERVVSLSRDQVRELFEKANPYQKRIVFIAMMTGIRIISEMCNLKWGSVDLDNGLINIGPKTKSKRGRTITMPQSLWEYMKKIRMKEPNAEYVINYHGIKVRYPHAAWVSLRKKLSFRILPDGSNLRLHDLRHVYATHLRMNGTLLSEIKELLGHTTLAVTLRYAHFDGAVNRKRVNSLNSLAPRFDE